MIEKVVIEQFQNHAKTSLDFDPGLNIICGQSDNGKSAIVRAISWVLTNKPSGDAFRKIDNEGTDTKVDLTFTNGEVHRIRGHKKNAYFFNGSEYKAMRSDVPEEIAEFINIGDQNIQSQFVSHYLVSESSGEVARTLNSIVGLEDIDKANKKVSRIIADANANVKFLAEELEKYETKLLKYEELDILDEQLQGLERIQKNIDSLESELVELESFISTTHKIQEEMEVADNVIENEEKVDTLLENAKGLVTLENECRILQNSIREITSANRDVSNGTEILSESGTVTQLIKSYESLEDNEDLADLIFELQTTGDAFKTACAVHSRYDKEYKEELKNQKICPLCERSI